MQFVQCHGCYLIVCGARFFILAQASPTLKYSLRWNVLAVFVFQEAEAVLLRRLDALERLVFGRSCSAASSGTASLGREVEPLVAKVNAISKSVARAEGGDRNLQDIAAQGDGVCM